jgi:DNA-binding transcriptional ArsR family regulator
MSGGNEEEIYSIMFRSLKHPVRRRILHMLNDKSMTFMEIMEQLGVSSSHLTYHLESLGELIAKTETGQYLLSSFGKATVGAMKGVEEAPELETRRRPKKMALKWKAVFAALMVTVLLLSSIGVYQYTVLTQLSADQSSLEAENQQLLSWGIGTSKVADFLRGVVLLDTNRYKITLLSNTLEYRDDFSVAEEVIKYSLTNSNSKLEASFRYRENHLSRYQLTSTENTPLLTESPSSSILDTAKDALNRYTAYSADAYLTEMRNLLSTINATDSEVTTAASDNMKLQITQKGSNAEFLWMYTQNGIDFSAKSLRMTFEKGILTALTDGYFLFTIANAELNVNVDQASTVATNHLETLTWNINGSETTDFVAQKVVSIQMLPHPRGNSVALVPYWYVTLQLDKTYPGGFNMATVGVWADTGKIADVQLLSS